MPSTVLLRPKEESSGKNGWKKKGEGTYGELTRKKSETTLAEQEAHDEGGANPTTATGIESLSKNTSINNASVVVDKYEGNLLLGFTMPAGSTVLKVVLHVYGHAAVTTAKALVFFLEGIVGEGEEIGVHPEVFIDGAGSTTTNWYSREWTLTEAQKKGACERLEKTERLTVEVRQTTSVAALAEIFKWYIVVTYEPGAGVTPAPLVMAI